MWQTPGRKAVLSWSHRCSWRYTHTRALLTFPATLPAAGPKRVQISHHPPTTTVFCCYCYGGTGVSSALTGNSLREEAVLSSPWMRGSEHWNIRDYSLRSFHKSLAELTLCPPSPYLPFLCTHSFRHSSYTHRSEHSSADELGQEHPQHEHFTHLLQHFWATSLSLLAVHIPTPTWAGLSTALAGHVYTHILFPL